MEPHREQPTNTDPLADEEARQLARRLGAYFAARRPVVEKPCAYCGKLMQGLRHRRYCS